MFIITICASNEENALLAGAFEEYRDSHMALGRKCRGHGGKVSEKLTAFFEEPFWMGVFERVSEGKLFVCQVTFGAKPKDAGRNPKQIQREVRKQMQNTGVRIKSQQLWR